MGRWKALTYIAIAVVTLLATAKLALDYYYRHQYPYGWSHCCDTALRVALFQYAERHDGWFPKGEASPEASLSLLYRDDPSSISANILRGKTVPEDVVKARLDSGELLTPETCGWHYVEGLRRGDDQRLALFWDKAGLDHNGRRLPNGGHMVCLITITMEYIPGDRWEEFMAEQKQLHAQLER